MIRCCLASALVLIALSPALATDYPVGYDEGYAIGYDEGLVIGQQRGTELGAADGYTEGFDTGWQHTYWPAYHSAYEISQPRGYRHGWIESYTESFAVGVEAISETFGSWEAGIAAVSGSLSLNLSNLSLEGHVDGLDFILWSNDKFSTSPYQQGYDDGFSAGDQFGFDQAYGPAYDAAYGPALAEGETEGAIQGPIDGQRQGYDDGMTEGQSAGAEFGQIDVTDYFLAGGSLANWRSNQSQSAAAAFERQHPGLAARIYETVNLTEATNLTLTTVGLSSVAVVPEPSGALLLCCLTPLLVLRRRNAPL